MRNRLLAEITEVASAGGKLKGAQGTVLGMFRRLARCFLAWMGRFAEGDGQCVRKFGRKVRKGIWLRNC